MLMRTKIILVLTMLFSGTAIYAQEPALQQAFEQELMAKNENVNSITCIFAQTREMSVLANAVKKNGNFCFMRPGNMLLQFNDGDYIKMTNERFEMNTAGNKSSTKISSNPMLKSLNTILSACVAGDFGQMAKGFATDIEQTEQEWIVTMKPQRGKAASKIARIVIHFDKSDMSLNILKMEEKSGDYTMYSFTDKKFNAAVDSQIFNITK